MDSTARNEWSRAKQPSQHHHIAGASKCVETSKVSDAAHGCVVKPRWHAQQPRSSAWRLLTRKSTSARLPRKGASARRDCTTNRNCAAGSYDRENRRVGALLPSQRVSAESASQAEVS